MQLKELLTEDRAVSPVIGIILMVAITVILAAVIGTFVLGFGSNLQTAPQVSFDFEFNTSNNSVTVTHDGGDRIDTDNSQSIVLRDDDGNGALGADSEVTWLANEADGAITAGDTAELLNVNNATTVRIVWTDEKSEESATIGAEKAPNG